MGKDKLAYWDRNAPLPQKDMKPIKWEDATDQILSAYSEFSPELGALGKKFFDKAWIDAPVRAGKAPGAFRSPDRAVSTPLSTGELPRKGARRYDACP